LTCL